MATGATRAATESGGVDPGSSEKGGCKRKEMREENEARRERERNRHEGKGSQAARVLSTEKGEMRWENGKGKGKVSDGGRSGKIVKHEGKGWSVAGGWRMASAR